MVDNAQLKQDAGLSVVHWGHDFRGRCGYEDCNKLGYN